MCACLVQGISKQDKVYSAPTIWWIILRDPSELKALDKFESDKETFLVITYPLSWMSTLPGAPWPSWLGLWRCSQPPHTDKPPGCPHTGTWAHVSRSSWGTLSDVTTHLRWSSSSPLWVTSVQLSELGHTTGNLSSSLQKLEMVF